MTTRMSWRRTGLFLGAAVATLVFLRMLRLGEARIGLLETLVASADIPVLVVVAQVLRQARAAKAFLRTTGSTG